MEPINNIKDLPEIEQDIIYCAQKCVQSACQIMCKIALDPKREVSRQQFVVFQNQIRILKPADCAFTSVIEFLGTHSRKGQRYKIQGLMAIYFPEPSTDTLLRGMGITGKFDETDIMDGCGEILNVIAGQFKVEMANKGYEELMISTPFNFNFQIDELFNYHKTEKFELIYFFEGNKLIYVDVGVDIKKVA